MATDMFFADGFWLAAIINFWPCRITSSRSQIPILLTWRIAFRKEAAKLGSTDTSQSKKKEERIGDER